MDKRERSRGDFGNALDAITRFIGILSVSPHMIGLMENLAFTDAQFAADCPPTAKLTDLELRVLDFERQWWRYAGAKESAVKELFNLNPPAYYQLLNNLIDREDALLAYPMLVKRLRRLREARTNARSTHFTG